MSKYIKVTIPANINKNDKCHFKNNHYHLKVLKVKELKDIIITNTGICLTDKGPIKESIQSSRDWITICTLTAKLELLTKPTFYINELNSFLIIHSPLFSYYHWFTESIPRLFLIKKKLNDLILLLPVSFRKIEFVQASLEPFNFKSIFYMEEGINVKVNHLVLPQIKQFSHTFYPEVVNMIRKFYTDYSNNDALNVKSFLGRVFLGNGKVVNNMSDVRFLLDKYCFQYIELSDTSFYKLVQLMYKTKLLISVDTDELVCINFMKKGTYVLELIRRRTSEIDKPSCRYLNLASSLGLRYFYQLCSPCRRSNLRVYPRINVDVKLLERNIIHMLKYQMNLNN